MPMWLGPVARLCHGLRMTGGGEVVARWVEALLTLARTARDRSVSDTLVAVADTVRSVLGYGGVAVNVYRPAQHDYEVVLVSGPPDAQATLLHTTTAYDVFHEQLLLPEFERLPGVYFLTGGDAVWDELEHAWTPPPGPGDWLADDGLVVALRSSAGEPLGLLSVDEPMSGDRPTDAELQMLLAVSAHAALALDTAQRNRAAARHRDALLALAGLSAQLGVHTSDAAVLERVGAVATEGFGFGSVTAYACRGQWLVPVTDGPPVPLHAALAALDRPDPSAEAGCRVVGREWSTGAAGSAAAHGRAWCDDRLLVPLRGRGGGLVGLLVLDDPDDGLRPDAQTVRELRLLADQAAAALVVTRNRSELDHQAHHDALTGLRNRRGLEAVLDELTRHVDGVAVLLCDLDHFKSVNDRFGHAAGDRVLERLGRLLREHARDGDVAVRYGGEEFCLLLPATDDAGARVVAERLRAATPTYLADLVDGQTMSVGVAATGVVAGGGDDLLRGADAALYAAKRAGRDCCFAARGAGRPERVLRGPVPT